ncbi:MAG TPA: hypothetical protein VL326_30525 [Kofleriaceae bacterium]|jgi:hypothetical protein|nr:hypothetical protein [Kofleriaceae bacterium]
MLVRLLALTVLLVPGVARADYREGIVPEGTNAFVHQRREIRLSLLGPSELAVTDHTEIGTYLLADAVLFPNLRVEHQLGQSEHAATSFMLGAGAGVLPLAGGTVLPLPGGVVAGGGVGFAWGSIQTATLLTSLRTGPMAFSLNAGGFAMEGGVAGVVGGVGAGGGGAGAAGGPAETHASRTGLTAGVEVSRTVGKRDAIIAAVDVWTSRRGWPTCDCSGTAMDGPTGIVYPRVTWTHQWTHLALTGGAYALIDLPKAETLHGKMPVAPFLNVAYVR